MEFSFKKLKISDLILISKKSYHDQRGFFFENYKESVFNQNGINTKFVQDNISFSTKHVLRGLHYQTKPKEQAKLVSVIHGEIFDVAVDIRRNSSTYGEWVGEILSQSNQKSLYVPEGFAHGFCVLSDTATVLYKVSNEYSPENEQGIIWNDPKVSVDWSIQNPIVSEKDQKLPTLNTI